eukprot:CAMPEP_0175113934 /NCGR_PEP_ID=MMETSP0086_2-20121207/16493_1 /TAXON_ID=136419 /ORGANISM="Unknown Unknown, Strain D1" /LENGTH=41 /DNA_ID= /DNA_START= /DNA_END= /DNA_ORIENTATION=
MITFVAALKGGVESSAKALVHGCEYCPVRADLAISANIAAA